MTCTTCKMQLTLPVTGKTKPSSDCKNCLQGIRLLENYLSALGQMSGSTEHTFQFRIARPERRLSQ